MTGYTQTTYETSFAGPLAYQAAGAATAGWVQAAAAVTTAQSLVTGATGASGAAGFVQPNLFGLLNKPGSLVIVKANGIASWVATSGTTVTFSFGVTPAVQGTATTLTSPTTLITSQVFPNQATAQANVPWRFEIELLAKQVGYGTAAVSTAILATGVGGYSPAITGAVGVVGPQGPMPPNVTTTFDNSVNNWLFGAVTFGVNASASNTCTMLNMLVFGCN